MTVTLEDRVSKLDQFSYIYEYQKDPSQLVERPLGDIHTILPPTPEVLLPFNRQFIVTLIREFPNNYFPFISKTWYIPIEGTLQNPFPNYYPVQSDPDLIFMVIRDPPGGSSYTTVHSGTSVSFGVSVNGMSTYSKETFLEGQGGIGPGFKTESGFGLMIGMEGKLIFGGGHQSVSSITAERVSSSHYEYSFTFEYDFSTSSDANLAGHASDVIIGGGVDLVVSEGVKGNEFLLNHVI